MKVPNTEQENEETRWDSLVLLLNLLEKLKEIKLFSSKIIVILLFLLLCS